MMTCRHSKHTTACSFHRNHTCLPLPYRPLPRPTHPPPNLCCVCCGDVYSTCSLPPSLRMPTAILLAWCDTPAPESVCGFGLPTSTIEMTCAATQNEFAPRDQCAIAPRKSYFFVNFCHVVAAREKKVIFLSIFFGPVLSIFKLLFVCQFFAILGPPEGSK